MMEVLIVSSIVAVLLMALRKDLWDKLVSMASLGVKISVMILILGWNFKVRYLVDVSLVLLMISSAGILLIFLLVMRSGFK